MKSYTDFTYADKTNYLTGIKHYSPIGTQNITYTYGNIASGEMPDQIYGVKWNGQEKVKYTYDGLGRLTNKTVGGLNNTYTYENVNATRTTTLVKSVQTAAGTYTYTYDNVGNILSIHDGTYTTSYEYDSLNQLVRENDQRERATYTYSYVNGNITEKKMYAYTTGELGEGITVSQWTYGDGTWSDLLTEYNEVEMTYDTIGNMVTIGDIELTWSGRQLQSVTGNGYTVSYQYNADGQRISKDVDGTLTEFFYNGSILAGQKTDDYVIVFMYDNNGDIFGFIYNGTEYYYVKNAQNDVIAIANASGTVIATYYYDAWGRVIDITGDQDIAYVNPILYRSYYFDYENGFYYLNSRYYSADICRFLNADGLVQTGQGVLDKNMFAYCMNNPIMYRDSSGQSCEFTITIPVDGNGPAIIKNGPTNVSVVSKKNSQGTYTYSVQIPATKTSSKGVAFIAEYEAFISTPYDDGFGNLTIGYGHLIQSNESFTRLTEAEALLLFANDLHSAEQLVLNYSDSLGIVWDQNEFDALVSLAFNSGNSVKYVIDSVNSGMDPYDAFSKIIKANGKPVLGLYRRRMDEADIFTQGIYEHTYRNW